MPRGIKQQKSGLDTDSSITDAAKRIRTRKAQLAKASGYEAPNEVDMLNDELENDEPESIRKIFED